MVATPICDVTELQSDALDGSILMAHRAFFRLDLVRWRVAKFNSLETPSRSSWRTRWADEFFCSVRVVIW